jgi:hypothetical protein
LYGFVESNPVNLFDPSGLAWRQKRPLDLPFSLRYFIIGPIYHDRFLFDDDTESGYYGNSRVMNDPASKSMKSRYKNVGEYLRDDVLRLDVQVF